MIFSNQFNFFLYNKLILSLWTWIGTNQSCKVQMLGVIARERYENIELIDASILSLVTIHSYCISPFLSFLPPTFLWQVFGAQALHCCHGAVNQNKNGTRVLLLRKLNWIPCLCYTAKKNYAILKFNSEALFTRTSHSHTIFWKVNLLSGISKYGLSHDFTSTFYLKNIISEAYFSKLACTFADFSLSSFVYWEKNQQLFPDKTNSHLA